MVWGGMMISNFCFPQLQHHKFEEIENLQKTEKRKLIVFIHTDWCQYCKAMQNTTFKDKKITESLNKDFYFIKFNAESKQNILFNNFTFKYQPTGTNTGVHELAKALGTINGKLSYPTLVIINTENEIIFQYNGFINTNSFSELIDNITKSAQN